MDFRRLKSLVFLLFICGPTLASEKKNPDKTEALENPTLKSSETLTTTDTKQEALEKPTLKSSEKLTTTDTKQVDENVLPPKIKGHILFFHNQGTRSHLIVLSALAKTLMENGYKVTTVFYGKSNILHENHNEILIEDK